MIDVARRRLHRFVSTLRGEGMRARLVQGAGGGLLIQVAVITLSLISAVVLARAMGPSGFGIYSFVMALFTVLAIPAQFGLASLVIRETAKSLARQDWSLLKGVWRWTGMVAIGLSVLLTLLAMAAGYHFSSKFSEAQMQTFYWGLALIPLMALGNLRGAALQGLGHVVLGQIPERVLRPALFLLLLATLWFWSKGQLTPPTAMGLQVGAASVAFLLGAYWLWQRRPKDLLSVSTAVFQKRAWALAALPLALTEGVQLVNTNADILMLGAFQAASDVGVYRVAAHGAGLVAFGLMALNTVVAPYFAQLHEAGEKEKLQRLVTRSAQVVLIIALGATAILFIFGEVLVTWLFGGAYRAAYLPLVILALGQLVNAMTGSVGYLLNMTGHEKEVTKGVALAALINVILNLVLIPEFSLVGAAIATAASMVIWNVFLWYRVRTLLGINASAVG